MDDYDKLCDALVEKAGGESCCKRYQERIVLGSGGIHARLFQKVRSEQSDELDRELGHGVWVVDMSRSGIGLISQDELDLNEVYQLNIIDVPQLKGTLVYRKEEPDGKIRYGFSLDEWLPDDVHQKLSV